MESLIFELRETPELCDIPALAPAAFSASLADLCKDGWRIFAFFGIPATSGHASLLAVLGNNEKLCALRSRPLREFPSIGGDCPQAQLFEREIYEDFGVLPKHHPWLKPVRITPDSRAKSHDADYGFYRIQGDQTHEVAVGPIHAGIIEPGHFRFQCYGEIVLNLEIALGYQHRGIEQKLLALSHARSADCLALRLVECIAGDSSVAFATAFCAAREKLLHYEPLAPQALRMRRIGLELERLACHCGDLGAIAGDTGYLPTSSWNGRIRGDFLNLTAALCGNRFGREYVTPGGAAPAPEPQLCHELLLRLANSGKDAIGSCEVMFASPSVRDRLAGTGALTYDQGLELGLVGVAARACGIACDSRWHYAQMPKPGNVEERLASSGDVLARAQVRFAELQDSLLIVKNDLEWLRDNPGQKTPVLPQAQNLPPSRLAVGLAEGWRGLVCHAAVTNEAGGLAACKFIDPSFHNWPSLAFAMRNGQISDFPLCNKSFNLSYCGHDM